MAADGRWYPSRTGRGEDGAGYLTAAVANGTGSAGVLEETANPNAAIGVEDLSYWPDRMSCGP